MSEPKYALVRWGRVRKHGQGKKIRLARITELSGEQSKSKGGAFWAVTKLGEPDDLSQDMTTAENFYLESDVICTWTEAPKPEEIRAKLDDLRREATREAARIYQGIIANLRHSIS